MVSQPETASLAPRKAPLAEPLDASSWWLRHFRGEKNLNLMKASLRDLGSSRASRVRETQHPRQDSTAKSDSEGEMQRSRDDVDDVLISCAKLASAALFQR